MRWVRVSPPGLLCSTIGDCTLLDACPDRPAAAGRARLDGPQYRAAPPARRRRGGCRRLSALCPIACRLARRPCLGGAGRDTAQLAIAGAVRDASAGPALGHPQSRPLVDDPDPDLARRAACANRTISLGAASELCPGHGRVRDFAIGLWRDRARRDILCAQPDADCPAHPHRRPRAGATPRAVTISAVSYAARAKTWIGFVAMAVGMFM